MVEQDVVYAAANGRELRLDIHQPPAGAPQTRGAVLLVHGGAWIHGEKAMMGPLAAGLAERGLVAVAVEYRLATESPWPAQRDDVATAFRWVKANAGKLGIDAARIALLGCSAGGQLALTAAAELSGEGVAAVVAFFAPGELGQGGSLEKGAFDATTLFGPDADPQDLRGASPIHGIDSCFPPVFLLHGAEDWLIDPASSLGLYARLVESGVPTELHILARAHHEFVTEPGLTGPVASEVALFLDRTAFEPERWRAEAEASNFFARGPGNFPAG